MTTLNLVAYGPPLQPSTWSGTPARLGQALANHITLGKLIDCREPKWQKILTYGLGLLRYHQRTDLHRIDISRRVRGWNVSRQLGISGSKEATLHFGTLHLPLLPQSKNQFIYTDATWATWSDGRVMPGNLKNAIHAAEKKAFHSAAHIFTTSHHAAKSVVEDYDIPTARVTAVGTGRGQMDSFFGAKKKGEIRILFVAKERFEDKGGDILLEGFLKARELNPLLSLTIAGHDSYPLRFAGLPVQAHGYGTFAEITDLFHTHHLFAMPAIHEPWGLVYLEALACRMPLLGLRRNAFPELSGEGRYGFIAERPTSESVCETILSATHDPDQLELMGQEGQKHVSVTYDWDFCATTILDVIKEKSQ